MYLHQRDNWWEFKYDAQAEIGKCLSDTALNDIRYLIENGVLRKNDEGGRSTNYSLMKE